MNRSTTKEKLKKKFRVRGVQRKSYISHEYVIGGEVNHDDLHENHVGIIKIKRNS